MSEIKLTLNPNLESETAQAAQAMAQAQETIPAGSADTAKDVESTTTFTPEEQAQIDSFSKQIDITDTGTVFAYGAGAQQNIA